MQFNRVSDTTNPSKKILPFNPTIQIHDKNQNSMSTPINKKVNLCLDGLDGNAFSIMGAFSRQARREGWTTEEVDTVLKEAQKSDYNHLLATILDYCESEEDKP